MQLTANSKSPKHASKASYITLDGNSAGLNPLVIIPLEPVLQFQMNSISQPKIAIIKDELIDNYLYSGGKNKKVVYNHLKGTDTPSSNGSGINTYS